MKKLAVTTFLVACFAFTCYSQQDTLKTNQGKQKPKATYQIDSAKVTVWENQGKNGIWKSFKVEKIYKKDDKCLTTNNFDEKELLELGAVIDKAIAKESVKVKKDE